MQIVIDIPRNYYDELQNFPDEDLHIEAAIKHGKPLPEHHGRLIDADKLREEMEKDVRRAMSFVDLKDFVWLAPTIIEADAESEVEE